MRKGSADVLHRCGDEHRFDILRCSGPMNILVTGCAGFIGWKVCETLLNEGKSVIGIDNMNDAYDVRLKEWRLSQICDNPDFTFHRVDITDRNALEEVFDDASIDAVINLAARAGVRQSLEDPYVYYETNVTGVLNLLELCKEQGIRKFVQASTSSVYGEGNRPFQESQNTDRCLSPYAASKKAAEALCYAYHYLYDLDVTVLRYFTVYGPAGRPDMSIFRFVKWIAEEQPVQLYGDGTQERDFTYVDDIAAGTIAGLKPMGFEIINLGSDRPVTVKAVIASLEKILDKQATIESHAAHPADVSATWAEIAKAHNLLDWEPKTALEMGLQQAANWYFQNQNWAKEIGVNKI